MGEAARQNPVDARRLCRHDELERRIPAGDRRAGPGGDHRDQDRRRTQRDGVSRILRRRVRRSGRRSRSQRPRLARRGVRVREGQGGAGLPAEGAAAHRARGHGGRRRRRTRVDAVSRHWPRRRRARRRSVRSGDEEAGRRKGRDRSADRRAAVEEGGDRRGAVRIAAREAADRTGAEDQGDPRSSGAKGQAVRRLAAAGRAATRAAAITPIIATVVLASVLSSGTSALAQRRGGFCGGGRRGAVPIAPNTPYDGRFTFVRVRYGADYGVASQGLPWSHDYPAGEQHFMKIINELSLLDPHTAETNILTFDDPQIFKYPVAYLCEPGGWTLTDPEAASLRTYLHKGGFGHRRRLPRPALGQLRIADHARPARGADLRHGPGEPDLPFVLRDQDARRAAVLRSAAGGVSRHLRRQRSGQADPGDDQLQHRHLRVLGVVGHRPEADRRVERGLQARRELHHLRYDTLELTEGTESTDQHGATEKRSKNGELFLLRFVLRYPVAPC